MQTTRNLSPARLNILTILTILTGSATERRWFFSPHLTWGRCIGICQGFCRYIYTTICKDVLKISLLKCG